MMIADTTKNGIYEDLLARVEEYGIKHSEVHCLEWYSHKQASEVRELQKALSDAHQYLMEERARTLQLVAENDGLRAQEVQDRARIQRLLLTDGHVLTGHEHSQGCSQVGCTIAAPHEIRASQTETNEVTPPPPLGAFRAHSLRRHYACQGCQPSVHAEAALMQVASLQVQLSEQAQFSNDRIMVLLGDRSRREANYAEHMGSLEEKLITVTKKLHFTQSQLQETTKDSIMVHVDNEELKETTRDATGQLTLLRETHCTQEIASKGQAAAEMQEIEDAADSELQEALKFAQAELKSRCRKHAEAQRLAEVTKANQSSRITKIEERCLSLAARNQQLEFRRALDVEGFSADVGVLRKQQAATARKMNQMRLLERLENGEQQEALLYDLGRSAPDVGRGRNPAVDRGTASHIDQDMRMWISDVVTEHEDTERRLHRMGRKVQSIRA